MDLFENIEELPLCMQVVCRGYEKKQLEKGLDYPDCKEFLERVERLGYTFEYGLDAEPFNLQKIK